MLFRSTRAALAADLKKFNVHANNINGENSASRKDEAISLIRQAELMESDAQTMRMKAYKMDPSLAPKTKQVAERKVFHIDVGDMTTEDAQAVVNAAKATVESAKGSSTKKPVLPKKAPTKKPAAKKAQAS